MVWVGKPARNFVAGKSEENLRVKQRKIDAFCQMLCVNVIYIYIYQIFIYI